MTETATPEALVASLTAALDEEEAAARAAGGGAWETGCTCTGACHGFPPCDEVTGDDIHIYPEGGHDSDQAAHIARQGPARTLRRVAAHREIVGRYAETLRDYARTLERARGGPVGNADLDDLEAELPVLRSVVEIIAGIYEEPQT